MRVDMHWYKKKPNIKWWEYFCCFIYGIWWKRNDDLVSTFVPTTRCYITSFHFLEKSIRQISRLIVKMKLYLQLDVILDHQPIVSLSMFCRSCQSLCEPIYHFRIEWPTSSRKTMNESMEINGWKFYFDWFTIKTSFIEFSIGCKIIGWRF